MRKQQANPAMARDDLLPEDYALDQTISEAATWLYPAQGDGHWVFELEAMRRSRRVHSAQPLLGRHPR